MKLSIEIFFSQVDYNLYLCSQKGNKINQSPQAHFKQMTFNMVLNTCSWGKVKLS